MIPKETKKKRRAYEVMAQVLSRGDSVELAKLLGRSAQLVTSWCRPPKTRDKSGSGQFSPLDTIRTLVLMFKDDDPTRPYPIAEYIAGLMHGVFVPIVKPTASLSSDIFRTISRVSVKMGAVIESTRLVVFEACDDKEDKIACSKDIDDAIVSLLQLKQIINSKR